MLLASLPSIAAWISVDALGKLVEIPNFDGLTVDLFYQSGHFGVIATVLLGGGGVIATKIWGDLEVAQAIGGAYARKASGPIFFEC